MTRDDGAADKKSPPGGAGGEEPPPGVWRFGLLRRSPHQRGAGEEGNASPELSGS